MTKHITLQILLSGLVLLLLAGCGSAGMSYSPEEAALNAIVRDQTGNTSVDPNSIKLLQSLPFGNSRKFVLIAFEGTQKDWAPGNVKCLYLYEVEKRLLGTWSPSSGGGGCSGHLGNAEPAEPPTEPIEIQGGITSRGLPDPGTSTLSGQVYDDNIQTIKVFWADGTSQSVGVINKSYLIVRNGQVEMSRVEAFDWQGNIVYSHQPEVAPGKN